MNTTFDEGLARNQFTECMGLTLRYIPTSSRITNPEICTPFLYRGNAVPGANSYGQLPRFIEGRHMPFHGHQVWSKDKLKLYY